MKRIKKGFTLIELMIVVAIIAILVTVTVPQLKRQIEIAKDSKGLEKLGEIRSSALLYMTDHDGTSVTDMKTLLTSTYVDTKMIQNTAYNDATASKVGLLVVGQNSTNGGSDDTGAILFSSLKSKVDKADTNIFENTKKVIEIATNSQGSVDIATTSLLDTKKNSWTTK